jgi:hypothetical protein
MSVASSRKRKLEDEKAMRSNDVVILSNMGDTRPEEMVPDAVTTFCLNHGGRVVNYVCVPYCSDEPIFLANYEDGDGS